MTERELTERELIKNEQKFWNQNYPKLKIEILEIDDLKGTKYRCYKSPNGNEYNIFTSLNSSRQFQNYSFIWRYSE